MLKKIDKSQTGFVPRLGTHVNLIQVIKRIIKSQEKKGLENDAFLINFSNAYNTDDREKIYDLMQKKDILKSNEILFMKKLHEMVEF